MDRAKHLISLKTNDKEKYRVVIAVDLTNLWGSHFIVFKGDSHFKDFFNRNDEYQKWLHLSDDRNIQTECALSVPNDLQIAGFKEVITDEGEIWFIGELK